MEKSSISYNNLDKGRDSFVKLRGHWWHCVVGAALLVVPALVVLAGLPALAALRGGAGRPLVCYYTLAARARPAPRDLPAALCTHLNAAFARVLNNTVYLEPEQYTLIRELVALKRINPALKIMLSIGGAGENNGFSEMVVNHASRKIFIRSIKKILRDLSLDGIDLDWEFPVLHSAQLGYSENESLGVFGRERQHFSQLLREIRMEYIREKKDYLLSIALAAPQTIVDVAYDVDQINMYVDYANIMTYDFHYFSKFTPITGLNSPLYARSSEELFLATLNINYTIGMYLSKGLARDKIMVGIPTYGHSFKLVNPENTAVGSPASGFGDVGSRGFADYPAACALARLAAARWDGEARVPYLAHGSDWLSYETPRSVAEKAAFVRRRGLRGAMLYSLNADDYRGGCSPARADDRTYPLTRAVAAALTLW